MISTNNTFLEDNNTMAMNQERSYISRHYIHNNNHHHHHVSPALMEKNNGNSSNSSSSQQFRPRLLYRLGIYNNPSATAPFSPARVVVFPPSSSASLSSPRGSTNHDRRTTQQQQQQQKYQHQQHYHQYQLPEEKNDVCLLLHQRKNVLLSTLKRTCVNRLFPRDLKASPTNNQQPCLLSGARRLTEPIRFDEDEVYCENNPYEYELYQRAAAGAAAAGPADERCCCDGPEAGCECCSCDDTATTTPWDGCSSSSLSDEESSVTSRSRQDLQKALSSRRHRCKNRHPGGRKKVSFQETVSIVEIPDRLFYTPVEREKLWTSVDTILQQADRNRVEYLYEGCDWKRAVEEDGFYTDQDGRPIHPAHVSFCASKKQHIDVIVQALLQELSFD